MTKQKQKNKFLNFILLIFTILLLLNCGKSVFYNETITFVDNKWYKNDAIEFNVNISDTTKLYNFYINLRNTINYKYSNIYFFLTTYYPNNGISIDTIECLLADKTGKWLGKRGSKTIDNRIIISKNIFFPCNGSYKFVLKQAMREDTLKGISEAGIMIENVK